MLEDFGNEEIVRIWKAQYFPPNSIWSLKASRLEGTGSRTKRRDDEHSIIEIRFRYWVSYQERDKILTLERTNKHHRGVPGMYTFGRSKSMRLLNLTLYLCRIQQNTGKCLENQSKWQDINNIIRKLKQLRLLAHFWPPSVYSKTKADITVFG